MAQLPKLEERTLLRSFERALDFAPDKVALADRDASSTYAQAFQRSLSLAGALARLGCRENSPAALMLDNSLDFVHAWLGMGLTGVVEVPVNTAYKGDFLAHILRDSGVETLLAEAHYLDRVKAIAGQVPSLKKVVVRGSLEGVSAAGLRLLPWAELEDSAPATPARREPGDLFAYMYTSGTTGLSKGVLIPEAQAYTYASREDQDLPTHEDRILVALPLFHLAGQWYGVYQSIIHRASCVVEPGFSPSAYWEVVRRQGITVTVMLGAMAEMLQQQPASPEDRDNPLRLAVMAPLASDFATFERRFGLRVAAVYGMSEIGAVMNGPPGTVVGGEAGFARDGYELRLVGPDGTDVGEGEVGELWVRPLVPHTVMAGYHNLPEATAAATQGGWIHTGDAFRRDAEGRYFFTDRMKDALRRRGENISSFEVEKVVNSHPSVLESAVVGVPSALGEDEIKAVIVLRAGFGADPVGITEHLIERLPYFMVPRYIAFVPALPKTPTQKVQKNLLRSQDTADEIWDREAAGIILKRSGRAERREEAK
ncbi:MAG: AMP-binding protein [Actinomycetota bacterium]|nr:AMP-binding protein [Actinomycetota bacterium]